MSETVKVTVCRRPDGLTQAFLREHPLKGCHTGCVHETHDLPVPEAPKPVTVWECVEALADSLYAWVGDEPKFETADLAMTARILARAGRVRITHDADGVVRGEWCK
jgi:hypothetical protein